MGGGKDSSVSSYQSPQQQQIFEMLAPVLGQLFGMDYTPMTPGTPGTQAYGTPGGGDKGGPESYTPGTPGTPATGGFTPGDPWQPPTGLSPTADWYSNLSPELMAGLQQPYMDAQRQGMELLGGSAGSARGGATGAAGAMTGEIMGQMAQNVPMQAWGMGAEQRQALMLPYTGALATLSGTYPEAVVQPGSGMDPLSMLLAGGMTAGSLGWSPFG